MRRTTRGFTAWPDSSAVFERNEQADMPNPKVCAICGYRQATTKDHLPPRSVFPKPLPMNTRTVPACSECNNGANQQDERFRVYLAAATTYFNDDATRAWKEGAMRTLEKNLRLRREFDSRLKEKVRVEVRPGEFEERIRIEVPVSAYAPVIERIVRGLFYHHFGRALGTRNKCQVEMLTGIPDEFYAIAKDWHGGDVGGQMFVYKYAYMDDVRSFWVLQFFEAHWVWVETYPGDDKPMVTDATNDTEAIG